MPEEASLGDRVTEIGSAVKGLGIDLEEMLEDPSKLEQYSKVAIASLLAYVAWEKAPYIKARLYMLTSWLKTGSGGKALSMQWYDWALMLTGVGAIYEAYRLYNYTGDVVADVGTYDAAVKAYPDKVKAWQAQLAALRAQLAATPDDRLGEGISGPSRYQGLLGQIADLEASKPQPPPMPGWMNPTWEERALYASLAFMVGMHPELIAELVKGVGFIVQGIGQIVPG